MSVAEMVMILEVACGSKIEAVPRYYCTNRSLS